jgi:hypothetical protein
MRRLTPAERAAVLRTVVDAAKEREEIRLAIEGE